MTRSTIQFVAAGTAILAAAAWLVAGPLTPPSGPITSTYKTLVEVEPRTAINSTNTPGDADSVYRITQSGSYYLTGNLVGAIGKHGIQIEASNVSIDFNGFTLSGVPGMGAFSGVSAVSNVNIRLKNGTLTGWGDRGIFLAGQASLVENVVASSNLFHGIDTGTSAVVRGCSAVNNGGWGIIADDASTVQSCTAQGNAGVGIYADAASVVSECSVFGGGEDGVYVGATSIIRNCSVRGVNQYGLRTSSTSMIINNTVATSGVGGGGLAGAGIFASGSDNRIEGNNVSQCGRGLLVPSAGNVIFGNSCTGSTNVNYSLGANNVFGAIVDRTAPGSAAVSGSAAASSTGTTDPYANFSY